MKTTIDLDEEKLNRVMNLTGIQTRKEAIDYALTEAERQARITRLLLKKWKPQELMEALDSDYDLLKIREMDKPKYGRSSR